MAQPGAAMAPDDAVYDERAWGVVESEAEVMVLQGDVTKLAVGRWRLAGAATSEACSCCDGVLPIGCTR